MKDHRRDGSDPERSAGEAVPAEKRSLSVFGPSQRKRSSIIFEWSSVRSVRSPLSVALRAPAPPNGELLPDAFSDVGRADGVRLYGGSLSSAGARCAPLRGGWILLPQQHQGPSSTADAVPLLPVWKTGRRLYGGRADGVRLYGGSLSSAGAQCAPLRGGLSSAGARCAPLRGGAALVLYSLFPPLPIPSAPYSLRPLFPERIPRFFRKR